VSKPKVRSNIYSKELIEGPVLRQITQSPCTQFLQDHCNNVLPCVPVTRVIKDPPLILLYVIHRSTAWCSVTKEAVPLQAWSSLLGSRKLRSPDSGCQPCAPAAFTPRKCSWYSFLLEFESTPDPLCDRKDFM